jgi:anti-sigma factor (TIGR02949 family)
MTESAADGCSVVLAQISAYLDGELHRPACEAIEHHCQSCSRCADLVAGLRETIGLCRNAAAAPVPEPVRAKARARIAALLQGKSSAD